MNKSPEHTGSTDAPIDPRFAADLAREVSLERRKNRPEDPELAADWDLKRELRELGAAELPTTVRARVFRSARARPGPPWFVAAAAAVLAAVVVAIVWQAPVRHPGPATVAGSELGELRLALNTIQAAGRRTLHLAGREISGTLVVPDLGLEALPYARQVRPVLQPIFAPAGTRSETDPDPYPPTTEENSS